MITAPDRVGVAFSEAGDGDLRADDGRREQASTSLGIESSWATARQVHGNTVRFVESAGPTGEGDALWTTTAGLPLAIFTADCFGIVVHSPSAVGVAHVGWRGAETGVVEQLRTEMTAAGHAPESAEIGPGIGPCCFEVGPEVASEFEDHLSRTTWGTTSVDLPAVVTDQLAGLDLWAVDACTRHGSGWFSHRKSGTSERLAALGWVP